MKITLPIACHHQSGNEGLSTINPGIGFETDHFVGGVYRNSYRNWSCYAALKIGGRCGVLLGVVTGYDNPRLAAIPYVQVGHTTVTVRPHPEKTVAALSLSMPATL